MTEPRGPSAHDVRRQLDAAMIDQPALPGPADRLRRGRRALRRRRLARGVAGVAAVVVVGSGVTWAVGDVEDQTGTDPASSGSAADLCPVLPPMSRSDAASLPDVEPTAKVRPFAANETFAYDGTDESFSYRPGLRGLQHLTGTLTRPGHADTRWDAAAVEGTNGTWYGLATFTRNTGPGGGGGGSSRFTEIGPGGPALAPWVAFHLEVRTDSDQDVLDVDDDGVLQAAEGVQILHQAEAPVAVGFSTNSQVTVAEIRRGPDTCFAVVDSALPLGSDELSTAVYLVPPEYAGGDTLEDFVETATDVRRWD